MIKTTVKLEGMMCSMCEAHVNDAIRRAFAVKSVRSSHKKQLTEIESTEPLSTEKLREAIAALGYRVLDIMQEKVEKKSLFSRLFGK